MASQYEEFAPDHIHTTPEGRHFRHDAGVEVDGEGNPLPEIEEPDRRDTPRSENSYSILRRRPSAAGKQVNRKGHTDV